VAAGTPGCAWHPRGVTLPAAPAAGDPAPTGTGDVVPEPGTPAPAAAATTGAGTATTLDRLVDSVLPPDTLAPVAGVDHSAVRPVPTWVAPAFAVFAALTVPWVVVLAMTLPRHAVAYHFRGAWVGFDIGLVVLLAATAYQAWQGRARVAIAATATATMLVVDAWFDVLTSAPGPDKVTAMLLAALVELPLAALCVWLALHAEQVVRARIVALARRADRTPAGTPGRGLRRGGGR